jgi:hypothetical protein
MKIQDKAKTVEIHSPKIRLPKHGYTKIELKDPYTCRKQVFESENMLTNAAENYFVNGGLFNNFMNESIFTAGNTDSIVYHMFGGVMLFDDEIPENANNTGIPAANMTANMAVDVTNNTNPPELGSYSATESGWQQDGSWVQVYNFTTTQGNGDIASACLSSRYLAGIGVGNQSGTYKTLFTNHHYNGGGSGRNGMNRSFFKIDYANSIGYAVAPSELYYQNINAGKEFHVYKYRIPLSVIDLKNKWKLLETYTYTIPSGSFNIGSSYYRLTFNDGKVIIAGSTYESQWDSSHPLQIHIIDENGITSHRIDTPPVEGQLYHYNDGIYVYNGAYYLMKRTSSGADATTIYKVRLSDNAILKTITATGNTSNIWGTMGNGQVAQPISNNQYIIWGDNKGCVYDFENDRIAPCNMATQSTMNAWNQGKIIGADGLFANVWFNSPEMMYIYRNMYKIMSINNLDDTVTKTPDKTMKVTYRITF